MGAKRLGELKLGRLGWLPAGVIFAVQAFGLLFGSNYLKSDLYCGD